MWKSVRKGEKDRVSEHKISEIYVAVSRIAELV